MKYFAIITTLALATTVPPTNKFLETAETTVPPTTPDEERKDDSADDSPAFWDSGPMFEISSEDDSDDDDLLEMKWLTEAVARAGVQSIQALIQQQSNGPQQPIVVYQAGSDSITSDFADGGINMDGSGDFSLRKTPNQHSDASGKHSPTPHF